jgi:peptidyl-prolyl cis-trans isomerase D
MISKIREWTLPIMVVILVSFVIGTIFLNWGMNRGAGGTTKTQTAGIINGQEVPMSLFDHEVNVERQRVEHGVSEDQYQMHMLPMEVWERTVNQTLMNDFYKKAGLFGSADEVFDYLVHNPPPGIDTASMFRTNGVFDTNKYVQFLNDPRAYEYNPGLRSLEQQASQQIVPGQKLETLLDAALLPSRVEVEYLFKAEYEKAVFEYAAMKNDAVKVDLSKITDDAAAKYYADHRDSFKSDEQVDLYTVRVLKTPTPRDEQTYFQELADLKTKILGEKDVPRSQAFAEEAKVSSDDEASAQNGGELGWIKRGVMAPALDSVAFSLDTGSISDPIKTPLGIQLIYVEKREKRDSVMMVKVSQILRKIIPTGETLDALQEKADSLRKNMEEVGFAKAARDAAQKDPTFIFDSTGLFPRTSPVPGIGFVSGLGHFLLGTDKESENISERLENPAAFYLFSVKQRVAKGIPPFAAVKQRIIPILVDSLRRQAIRSAADAWAAGIPEDAPLANLKKTDSGMVVSGLTDTVTRMSRIPGIGADTRVAAVAFALPVGKRSKIFENNGSYYLVRTLWKGPAAPALPWGTPPVQSLIGQLMNQTRQSIYSQWYRNYKANQKIVSNVEKIYID